MNFTIASVMPMFCRSGYFCLVYFISSISASPRFDQNVNINLALDQYTATYKYLIDIEFKDSQQSIQRKIHFTLYPQNDVFYKLSTERYVQADTRPGFKHVVAVAYRSSNGKQNISIKAAVKLIKTILPLLYSFALLCSLVLCSVVSCIAVIFQSVLFL